jgi:hypothetical protein
LPDSIPYNGNSKLYWISEKNVISVKINGIMVYSLTDSIPFNGLIKDTTLVVKFEGVKDTITETVQIKVAEKPVPTKLDTMLTLFCNKPWRLVDMSNYTMDGQYIDSWTLTKNDTTEIYWFYTDYSRANDKTAYGGGWSRTGPKLLGIYPKLHTHLL